MIRRLRAVLLCRRCSWEAPNIRNAPLKLRPRAGTPARLAACALTARATGLREQMHRHFILDHRRSCALTNVDAHDCLDRTQIDFDVPAAPIQAVQFSTWAAQWNRI